jgi:hypothetical protein
LAWTGDSQYCQASNDNATITVGRIGPGMNPRAGAGLPAGRCFRKVGQASSLSIERAARAFNSVTAAHKNPDGVVLALALSSDRLEACLTFSSRSVSECALGPAE